MGGALSTLVLLALSQALKITRMPPTNAQTIVWHAYAHTHGRLFFLARLTSDPPLFLNSINMYPAGLFY